MKGNRLTHDKATGFVALVFAAVVASTAAHAACAISLGSGISNSQNRAIAFARQDAFAKVAQATYGAPVTNLDYSEPVCLYLEDGTDKIKCQVQISFCTQLGLSKPHFPQQPPLGGNGQSGGKRCLSLTAKAQSQSLDRAKAAVIKTMSRALAERAGVGLDDPRVTGKTPECNRIYGGVKTYACKMKTRFCN